MLTLSMHTPCVCVCVCVSLGDVPHSLCVCVCVCVSLGDVPHCSNCGCHGYRSTTEMRLQLGQCESDKQTAVSEAKRYKVCVCVCGGGGGGGGIQLIMLISAEATQLPVG